MSEKFSNYSISTGTGGNKVGVRSEGYIVYEKILAFIHNWKTFPVFIFEKK